MLAQDYAFGRDGVKAFKDALKKSKIVHEEYLPQSTTDFTAGIQRIVDADRDLVRGRVVLVIDADVLSDAAEHRDLHVIVALVLERERRVEAGREHERAVRDREERAEAGEADRPDFRELG